MPSPDLMEGLSPRNCSRRIHFAIANTVKKWDYPYFAGQQAGVDRLPIQSCVGVPKEPDETLEGEIVISLTPNWLGQNMPRLDCQSNCPFRKMLLDSL